METFIQEDKDRDGIIIRTDNKWKQFKYGYEVPKKVMSSQFDYLEDGEHQDGFFKFHNTWYHTSEFTALSNPHHGSPGSPLTKDWDGIANESYSSGALLKISKDGEQYKVASYYVSSIEHWNEKQAKKMHKNAGVATVLLNLADGEKAVPIANPIDYDHARNLYLFGFGAYNDEHVLVFGRGAEDALEEAAGFLLDHAMGGIFVDQEELKRLYEEALEEVRGECTDRFGFDEEKAAEKAQEKATTDLTYTEAGYIPSWEWTVDEVTDPDVIAQSQLVSRAFMEDPSEPWMQANGAKFAIVTPGGYIKAIYDDAVDAASDRSGPDVVVGLAHRHAVGDRIEFDNKGNEIPEEEGMQANASLKVLTEEFLEMLPAKKQKQWPGYTFKMAYNIVTPESAEEGDTAENGWEVEQSEAYSTLESLLRYVNDHTWLEWSSSHVNPSHDSIVSDGEEDFSSGDRKSFQLWIERVDGLPISKMEFDFINASLPVLYGKHAKFSMHQNPGGMKRDGWFIVNSSGQIFTLDVRGHEKWRNLTKKGIAAGSFDFQTEQAAKGEIQHWQNSGHWPLMTLTAKHLSW